MRLVLLVFLLAVFAASSSASRQPPAVQAFRSLLDADWKYWMAQYPEAATLLGYEGEHGRWTDYSPAAIEARAAYVRQSLERVTAIERDTLPASEHLDYDLYRELLQTAVDGLAFHNDAIPLRGVVPLNLMMPISQMGGIQQGIPQVLASMPANTRDDYDHIIARLEGVPALVDQTIAMMERGMKAGLTPPAITLRDVPAQVNGAVAEDAARSLMLAAFARWPGAVDPADREALTARATRAYEQSVRPAFRRLEDFLVKRYIPAARHPIAASALPNGGAMYHYHVRWHTTLPLTPKEIHDIGQREVKRIRAEMDRVIASTGFTGSYADFVKLLRTDQRFYYTDAEALLTGYRDIAKRADPALAPLFRRLPQTPYGVKEIPAAIAPSQTTAYYEPGALSVGRPANMYANTYKLEARPKWEMEALTLHEAVPGHHLQISLAQELEGLPEFRKHSSYTAFVEGWALYAESLGEEMGFYTDPYSKFGQLTYEMWRAVRLVVDTGMHAMGWTRQQAIDFFLANAAKTEQDIVVEIDRYIVMPAQALGYKLGQIKIRELRESATKTMGNRFDVRAFHDIVLNQGAVPLDVLEARVREWSGGR